MYMVLSTLPVYHQYQEQHMCVYFTHKTAIHVKLYTLCAVRHCTFWMIPIQICDRWYQ